tara:strand:- start:19 stop:492 length:474 start_codon:yes stop_codon:yes gene_type:complete
MNDNYINFYNNLVQLTRNKKLYEDFTKQDTFFDRLTIFLFHFAFFLNVFKSESTKKNLQSIFDYIFRQLELSIRELGHGDASINKKMKDYVNIFYSILNNIENWEKLDKSKQKLLIKDYINIKNESLYLADYFDNYRNYLKKNTFNSLIKGVIKLNF